MNTATLRSKYVSDSVETMSPGRMIVALYDRLLLDLDRAQAAVGLNDLARAHDCLVHAQAIVNELHDALDHERWPAARSLANLYRYAHAELVAANVGKDVARVRAVRDLLQPLRDAWHEASGIVASGTGGAA
jgi:flagellar protein FliS